MKPFRKEEVKGGKAMTVARVIKLLQAMPDKQMKVMIDCPYCGKGNQLSSINECVVLSSPQEKP
jgi:hypothetical protein